MSKIVNFFLVLSTALFPFFVKVPSVYACKCVPPRSVQEEALNAEAVFTGKVTQVEPSVRKGRVKITLNGIEFFKGNNDKTVVIETEEESVACGYEFRKGENYLVYAYGSGNNLGVSLCSRTRLLSQADEDLTALGQFSSDEIERVNVGPPPHGPSVIPPTWSDWLVALLWIVVILSVAVITGFLIIRLLKFRKQKSAKPRQN